MEKGRQKNNESEKALVRTREYILQKHLLVSNYKYRYFCHCFGYRFNQSRQYNGFVCTFSSVLFDPAVVA